MKGRPLLFKKGNMKDRLFRKKIITLLLSICLLQLRAQQVADFNLVHHEPGNDSWSAMPIGNGELTAQVWTNQAGGLEMYLGRSDSRDAMDQVLKVGKLSVSFEPNILGSRQSYTETLRLAEGVFSIKNSKAEILIRVDATRQLLLISGETKIPVKIKVTNNLWRRENRPWNEKEYALEYGTNKVPFTPYHEADAIIEPDNTGIGWYHRNSNQTFWQEVMKANELLNAGIANPLENRTFGAWVTGKGFRAENDTVLQSLAPQKKFTIAAVVECGQTTTADAFVNKLQQEAKKFEAADERALLVAHKNWWREFWNRSYVYLSAATPGLRDTLHLLNRSYILQRYVNAITGRGNLPIKFNGSTLVADTYNNSIGRVSGLSADTRLWGGAYWWQNTRLMYYPMLTSGDFDLIQPFIRFYWQQLQAAKIITKKFYQHEGARMIETSHFWGSWRGYDIGWDRTGQKPGIAVNPYIKDLIIAGLEITNYLLDYYAFTQDTTLLREKIIPFANEILLYYDQHYPKNTKGKILIAPAQSLETFVDGVNPTPDIAGLQFVVPRLKAIATGDLLSLCEKIGKAMPDIPFRTENGKRYIQPIAYYQHKINVEYPELYPIFPFRLYGIGKKDIQVAIETFNEKPRNYQGWQQTGIQAALLGLTDTAAKVLVSNGLAFDKRFRFPAFWGPNYDYTPDQCHAGNFLNTLQTMLLQTEDEKIFLLPAWPKNWDVQFRLHAPLNTVIQGEWRNGNWIKLTSIPSNRITQVLPNSTNN